VQQVGGAIRVLLRYLHRQRIIPTDLSRAIERRREYRQATIPRSITWDQVRTILAGIDRRAPVGKRDYAILLVLVTYGLRAHEVARLTLDTSTGSGIGCACANARVDTRRRRFPCLRRSARRWWTISEALDPRPRIDTSF